MPNIEKYTPEKPIIITKSEAWKIINFFWPNQVYISENEFTNADVFFAQCLIKEALEKTYTMGFIEKLFRGAYGKLPMDFEGVRKIIFSICKGFVQHIFSQYVQKEDEIKIYEAIRATIALKWKSIWGIRVNTGDLDY